MTGPPSSCRHLLCPPRGPGRPRWRPRGRTRPRKMPLSLRPRNWHSSIKRYTKIVTAAARTNSYVIADCDRETGCCKMVEDIGIFLVIVRFGKIISRNLTFITFATFSRNSYLCVYIMPASRNSAQSENGRGILETSTRMEYRSSESFIGDLRVAERTLTKSGTNTPEAEAYLRTRKIWK